MSKEFIPNYQNVVNAAFNKKSDRLALHELSIGSTHLNNAAGFNLWSLMDEGTLEGRRKFYKEYALAFKNLGFDTVNSLGSLMGFFNNCKSLKGEEPGPIQCRADYEKFDFDSIPEKFMKEYKETFSLMAETLPEGMKAIGGIGGSSFELMQDAVGFTEMCMMSMDDPELYTELYQKIGDTLVKSWQLFVDEFDDAFCVYRMSDDLGFKTGTLISPDDIKTHIIPQYKRIIDVVHSVNKPFVLHSCGCIFDVMDDLINIAGIDAKHSNEDAIAPFSEWVNRYGDKIGNFGGIEMNVLALETPEFIEKYTREVIEYSIGHGGFALGSGNSLVDSMPIENYQAVLKVVEEYR